MYMAKMHVDWVLYPPILRLLMPEYLGSIWVFRILLFQIYLVNIGVSVTSFLRSNEINRQAWMTLSYVVAGIVSYVSIIILWKIGMGIAGAALGIVIANLTAILINFYLAHRYYLENMRTALKYYVSILFPIVYTGLCIFLIEMIPDENLFHALPLQFLLVTIFTSPLFFFANKRLNLVHEVSTILSRHRVEATDH